MKNNMTIEDFDNEIFVKYLQQYIGGINYISHKLITNGIGQQYVIIKYTDNTMDDSEVGCCLCTLREITNYIYENERN